MSNAKPATKETGIELHQFPLTQSNKTDRMGFVLHLLDEIQEGRLNPLLVHLQIKNMADLIAHLTDREKYPAIAGAFMDAVLAEAEKYGSEPFDFHNASVQVKEAGTQYDYSECGHPVWNRLNAKREEMKPSFKYYENFLRNVPPSGTEVIDPVTGEIVTVYPPKKKSTTTVFVTLK